MASRGRPPLPLGTWGEISIQRRASGWIARARFRDFDGRTRHVSKTGRTKGAARNALTESLTRRVAPIADSEMTPETTMANLVNHYYDLRVEQGKWTANTRARYRGVLDDHIIPRVGGMQLFEVTVGRMEMFLRAVAQDVGSPTARTCRSVLSGAMKLAVRHGAILSNPIVDTEGMKVATSEPEILELEDVAMLRRVAAEYDENAGGNGRRTPYNAAIVDYLLGTGARIGEVFALRDEDLNIFDGWTEISGTVVRDGGKLIRQGHTKGGDARRLYLPRFTLDTLNEFVGTLPPNTEHILFPSAAGTIRDPNNYRKIWRRMVADAGLPKGTTPHTLRRTVATFIDRAESIEAVASQLGNTESVARKHYVKAGISTSDVSELLQGLVTPGLKAV